MPLLAFPALTHTGRAYRSVSRINREFYSKIALYLMVESITSLFLMHMHTDCRSSGVEWSARMVDTVSPGTQSRGLTTSHGVVVCL